MADIIQDKSIKQAAKPQATQAQGPKTGTGFTNVSNILAANKNNRLGSAITSGVGQVATQAKAGLGQAATQFQQAAQGSALAPAGLQKAGQVFGQQYSGVEDIKNKPIDVTKTLENIGTNRNLDLTKEIKGGYAGPGSIQDVADYTKAQNLIQDVGQLGQQVQSQDGRGQLLQRFVANPKYTQGQKTLDTLLLGGENLGVAKQQARDVALEQQRKLAATQGEAARIAQENQALAQNLRQAFGPADARGGSSLFGQLQAGIEGQLGQYKTKREADINAIKKAFESKDNVELTAEQAKALGLTEGANLGTLTADQLSLNAIPENADYRDIASKDDVAKYEALRRLSGIKGGIEKAGTLREQALTGLTPEDVKQQYEQTMKMYKNYADPYEQKIGMADWAGNVLAKQQASVVEELRRQAKEGMLPGDVLDILNDPSKSDAVKLQNLKPRGIGIGNVTAYKNVGYDQYVADPQHAPISDFNRLIQDYAQDPQAVREEAIRQGWDRTLAQLKQQYGVNRQIKVKPDAST